MCLLTIASPGATQNVEDLETACVNNPDGFGFAVHAGDRITTGHGMAATDVIERYLAQRAAFPNGPAMFHARLATHGTETVDNCHPFFVGGDEQIVLAHNGILPFDVAAGEHRSDTRIFAEEVLPRLGVDLLDDPAWRHATEMWLGPNKIAILSASPRLAQRAYVLNEDQGEWVDGIWWSNDSYRELPLHGHLFGLYSQALGDICEGCGAALTDRSLISELCEYCDTCLWCLAPIEECLCSSAQPRWPTNADDEWWAETATDTHDVGEVTGV